MSTNVFFEQDSWLSHAEGNTGVTHFVFTVMRDGDTTGTSTVQWGLNPQGWGDRAAANDFTGATSGTLTFAAGVTSLTFTVDVVGDTTIESGEEEFTVYLHDASVGTNITSAYCGAGIVSDDDSIGATAGTAKAMSVNGIWTEWIQGGDQDWFSLNVVAGTTYSLNMWGGYDQGDTLNPYLRLLASNGTTVLASNDDGGPGADYHAAQITYTATKTGIVYLSAQGSGVGGYQVFTSVVGQDDNTGTSIATTTASLFSPHWFLDDTIGIIESAGDQDWFRVYLKAGETYEFTDNLVDGQTATLILRDSSGDIVEQTSDIVSEGGGSNEQIITYTATADGDYYLSVNGTGGTTGMYGIRAEQTSIDFQSPDREFGITAFGAPTPEGNTGVSPYVFQVVRNGMTDTVASVNWTLAGSGEEAAAAADFQGGALPSGTVNFAVGEAVKYITINVAGDVMAESDETFTITLSDPSSGTTLAMGYESAIGTIRNDDAGTGATLTLGRGFDMLADQDWNWTLQAGWTDSQVTISDGTNTQVYGGSGFTYDVNGNVTGGTVTSSSYSVNGVQVYAITGMNAGAVLMQTYATHTGDTQDMYAYVLAGNDRLVGSEDGDRMLGYTGNDTLLGGGGNDNLVGGAGDDELNGGSGGVDLANYFYEGSGVSVTLGGSSAGTGTDASGGNDTLISIEMLLGSVYGDHLNGSNDEDIVERFRGNDGNDSINGGSGMDWAIYNYTKNNVGVIVNLATGVARDGLGGIDQLSNIEGVEGSGFNDSLIGSSGNEEFVGGSGNDTIDGGGGFDWAEYGYTRNNTAVTVNLTTGSASDGWGGTDTLKNIENVWGSYYNDSITGSAASNELYGQEGNDTLSGVGGNDALFGGNGNDRLTGGTGTDYLAGGEGSDLYLIGVASEHTNTEFIDDGGTGLSDVDEIRFTATTASTLTLSAHTSGIEKVVIGTGSGATAVSTGIVALNVDASAVGNGLTMTGNAGANRLTGTAFDDTINGGAGNDVLQGLEGSDKLYGGAGNDWLEHVNDSSDPGYDPGEDTLYGGVGNDNYVVDELGATIIEEAGEGTDIVLTYLDSFVLGANLENLYHDDEDPVDFTGTGNELSNWIRSTGGNDSLYGLAGNDTIGGGAGNDLLNGGAGADILLGGAGNDTYVVDHLGDKVYESTTTTSTTNAGGYDTVESSIGYTLGNFVENLLLTGVGHLNGTGNGLANTLTGNGGNNILDGKGGVDTFIGGLGNDTYVVDQAAELIKINEGEDEGTDLLKVTYANTATIAKTITLTAGLAHLENITLSGTGLFNLTGNDEDNRLTGNASVNILNGGAGNDTLDGKGGVDVFIGGLGDDTYVVDQVAELAKITENADEGTDLLKVTYANTATTAKTITLTAGLAHLESITVTGTGLFNLTGNGEDNLLAGNASANKLDGGLGADTLVGGTGNDTYVVDNLLDVITENSTVATEIDTVLSSVTWTLGLNLEKLTLTGTESIDGAGNAKANTLTGNVGNNVLDGGAGADILLGKSGNDTYVVDHLGDKVYETTSTTSTTDAGGTDTVESSISYTLGSFVEDLVLTGAGHLNGTGNGLDNTLTGNGGNNILDGKGGVDTFIGGLGNDTYVVDQEGELANLTENPDEGIDTLVVTYANTTGESFDLDLSDLDTFAAFENFENLTVKGTGLFNLIGNDVDNTLVGNASNNELEGNAGNDILRGGLGNDSLKGGEGADIFRFDTALNKTTNVDTIQDFILLEDHIQLENSIFTKLTAVGELSANNFRAGDSSVAAVKAADANDYILYDNHTGNLYYDADGSGTTYAAVKFATLVGQPSISSADFLVT